MAASGDWDELVGDAATVRAVFDNVPTPMCALDGPDFRFAAVNAAYRRLYPKATVGETIHTVFAEVANQRVFEVFEQVYRTGEPFHAVEWRVQVEMDEQRIEERYYDFVTTARRDDDGDIAGLQLMVTDATERVRARHAVEAQVEELAGQYAEIRESTTLMQHALLAPTVPVLPYVDIAARYLVAAQDSAAGGDWFDAVPLPDGTVALIVGDVVGHGVEAAAVMAQLRTATRMQMLSCTDIGAAVRSVDAFVPHVPGAAATTLCVVRVNPRAGIVEYCTAGHPPPLIVTAAGGPRYLAPSGSGPLGTGTEIIVLTEPFDEGDTILLYSDGIVERPGRPLAASTAEFADVASGILSGSVFPLPDDTRPVEQLCSHTLELLLRTTGYADDVTLLAAQRRRRPPALRLSRPATLTAVEPVRNRLRRWLGDIGAGSTDTLFVTHAMSEFLENAARHAYHSADVATGEVGARRDDDGGVRAALRHHGRWQPAVRHIAPTYSHGLTMAAAFVNDTAVTHDDSGTTATLVHRLSHRAHIVTEPNPRGPGTDARPRTRDFSIHISGRGHLVVHGDVDSATAPHLDARIDTESHAGSTDLTVDLTDVTHLGSAGVAALHQANDRASRQGTSLTLIAPAGSAAQHVLALANLPVTDPR